MFFLTHMDGGRYRGDFVELLRDAYWGRPASVEARFGLGLDALEALMRRFYLEGAR